MRRAARRPAQPRAPLAEAAAAGGAARPPARAGGTHTAAAPSSASLPPPLLSREGPRAARVIVIATFITRASAAEAEQRHLAPRDHPARRRLHDPRILVADALVIPSRNSMLSRMRALSRLLRLPSARPTPPRCAACTVAAASCRRSRLLSRPAHGAARRSECTLADVLKPQRRSSWRNATSPKDGKAAPRPAPGAIAARAHREGVARRRWSPRAAWRRRCANDRARARRSSSSAAYAPRGAPRHCRSRAAAHSATALRRSSRCAAFSWACRSRARAELAFVEVVGLEHEAVERARAAAHTHHTTPPAVMHASRSCGGATGGRRGGDARSGRGRAGCRWAWAGGAAGGGSWRPFGGVGGGGGECPKLRGRGTCACTAGTHCLTTTDASATRKRSHAAQRRELPREFGEVNVRASASAAARRAAARRAAARRGAESSSSPFSAAAAAAVADGAVLPAGCPPPSELAAIQALTHASSPFPTHRCWRRSRNRPSWWARRRSRASRRRSRRCPRTRRSWRKSRLSRPRPTPRPRRRRARDEAEAAAG